MKRWIVGGVAVLCAGAGVGLWLAKMEPQEHAARPEYSLAAVNVPQPAAAVVLVDVVEVADLDSLLDPGVREADGVPFDADVPATVPISTANAPSTIPPAVD